jgi:hypothetical protein
MGCYGMEVSIAIIMGWCGGLSIVITVSWLGEVYI